MQYLINYFFFISYFLLLVLNLILTLGKLELSRIKPIVVNWLNVFDSNAKQMLFPKETISKSQLVNALRDHIKLTQSEAECLVNLIGDFKFTDVQKSTSIELNFRTYAGKLEKLKTNSSEMITSQFQNASILKQNTLKSKLIQMANISTMLISEVTDLI